MNTRSAAAANAIRRPRHAGTVSGVATCVAEAEAATAARARASSRARTTSGARANLPSPFDDRLHFLLRHLIAQLHRLTPSFNIRRNADASSLRAFRSLA